MIHIVFIEMFEIEFKKIMLSNISHLLGWKCYKSGIGPSIINFPNHPSFLGIQGMRTPRQSRREQIWYLSTVLTVMDIDRDVLGPFALGA